MKLDKDALLKQKFWLLLGAFALLWVVSLSILAFAGSPADKAQTDYTNAKKAISANPHPKNESYLPPWQDYGLLFKKHKDTVWKAAWDGEEVKPGDSTPAPGEKRWQGQKEMYTWPSTDQHPLQTLLTYPDVPIDVAHREWYKTDDVYKKQFNDLYFELKTDPKQLAKDSEQPNPPPPPCRPFDGVAFTKAEDYYGVMKPVDWSTSPKPPDAEECWLAQEDFWVRREMLYVVKDALTMAARMDPADDEVKDPVDAKYAGRRVFKNANWRIELLFDRAENGGLRISPDSKIKNVSVNHREQDLGSPRARNGVWFLLRQSTGSWLVAFEGEHVAYDQERVMGKGKHKNGFPVTGAKLDEGLEVTQVFDASDAPITEIDAIAVPKVSHKSANRPLLPTKPERYTGKKETPAGTSPTAAPPVAVAPIPGVSAPMPAGSMNMPSPTGPNSGAAVVGNPTANKFFDRNRYLFVTEQSRHLPVAMTLTVDQSHLSDILVALANSRLRFQTTQVELRRIPAMPSQPGGITTPGYGPAPAASIAPMPFAPGPFTPGTAPTGTVTPPPADNPNLVEVTIYGIASLYERPRQ